MADEAHNRVRALSDRLLKAKTTASDEAIREEMASIAASMVALTAKAEGQKSPIHPMLAGKNSGGTDGRRSLAARAKAPVIALGGMTAERAAELGWPRWGAIDGLS